MPYPMKIQPIDLNTFPEPKPKSEAAAMRPLLKSRFKLLFERPFYRLPEKQAVNPPPQNCYNDGVEKFEPSSVCLAKMVQNFIEETNDKQRCGRKKCNCFNVNCTASSGDDHDSHNSFSGHSIDVLKSLVPCSSVSERTLLADTAKIIHKNKISKLKDEFCRKIVADGLIAIGYKASICKSKWEKTSSFLAGEYEYVDVMIEDERLIIDIDFPSEFEIARSTKTYKLVLQTLPNIFVGKADRLEKIISIVSDAAKQSLKKKGMPLPPWRKADYVKAKWLSPFTRVENKSDYDDFVFVDSDGKCVCEDDGVLMKKLEPLEIRFKNMKKGVRVVAGLTSIMEDKQ
ncbi:hypothetical protein CASFOL_010101 [Castilleja foliolosa]|uniref:DNA-directed RNA polymerase n=1 Tax=Castilleja foliolosa TaxID=1961234 RepID=A0ABD3DVS2_9LAMI